jgi:hypothetical protein
MKRLLLCFLVACGSPQPAPATSTTSSPSNVEPSPAAPPAAAPGMGEKCGDNDACAEHLTCVTYYGIAGPKGPAFKSCEIKCTSEAGCPENDHCVTIADGPGQVCRPAQ